MFGKYLLIALIVHSSVSGEEPVEDWSGRIVGGQKTRPQEFPMMASLQYRGQHFCGATIIGADWLMTAAHCVDAKGYRNFSVVMGTNDLKQTDGAQVRQPVKIIVNEKWDSNRLVNDVAVIKLNSPVHFDQNIQRAVLPPKGGNLRDGSECVAVGWGKTSASGTLSPLLLKVTLPVNSQRSCQSAYPSVQINDGHLCAGGESGRGICSGDSGGAFFCPESAFSGRAGASNRLVVVGVDSFTALCARQNRPSVFTKVSKYLQWVLDKSGISANE